MKQGLIKRQPYKLGFVTLCGSQLRGLFKVPEMHEEFPKPELLVGNNLAIKLSFRVAASLWHKYVMLSYYLHYKGIEAETSRNIYTITVK